ncbi:MAG: T9SS type A sorting domain-containing protein [Bacteroidia bacterium]
MKNFTSLLSFLIILTSIAVGQTYTTKNAPTYKGGECFCLSTIESRSAVWGDFGYTLSDFQSGSLSWNYEVYLGTETGIEDNSGEGIAFVIQQKGSDAIGGPSGALGYGGVVTPSVAIEIDTRYQSHHDPVGSHVDHLAMFFNGGYSSAPAAGPVILPNMEDGAYHQVEVTWTYNASSPFLSTLTATIDGTYTVSTNFAPSVLFNNSDVIYVGFTGAQINSTEQRVSFASPGSAGSCSSVLGALPVELTSFNGEMDKNREVQLNWTTARELNNNYFEVLRSEDGANWQIVGEVEGAGTTNIRTNYTFNDGFTKPNNVYYQLKQIDYDGSFEFSNVIRVELLNNITDIMSVFPNPAEGFVQLRVIEQGDSQEFKYLFADQLGRIVKSGAVRTEYKGYNDFSIEISDLTTGIYIVKMTNGIQSWTEKLSVK